MAIARWTSCNEDVGSLRAFFLPFFRKKSFLAKNKPSNTMLICKRDFYYPTRHICLECRSFVKVCYATYIYVANSPVDILRSRKEKYCWYNRQEFYCHLLPHQLLLGRFEGRAMGGGTYDKKLCLYMSKGL